MSYPVLTTVTNAFQTSTLTSGLPASTAVSQKFGLAARNGWSEVDSNGVKNMVPLGSSGPFVVQIGSEKILCIADEIGLLYVYNDSSTNGRAYSGTTIAAHLPGAQVTLVSTSVQSVATGGGGGSGITALTGDVTASGSGSVAATLVATSAVEAIITANPSVAAAAPLASPALTGTPTAPTAPVLTNTTQLATTAFVLANGGGKLLTQINGTTSGAIAAAVGDIVNTTAAATVTLPASPTIGQGVLVNRGNHTALITITANTGQTINGGASGGSVSMTAPSATANQGQALFMAQSATAWSVIALGTDLGQGWGASGVLYSEGAFNADGGSNLSGNTQFYGKLLYHSVVKTTTYSTIASDLWIRASSGSWTLTLTAAGGSSDVVFYVSNEGTGYITVAASSGVVNGVTLIPPGGSAMYLFNGTNWDTASEFGCPLTQLAPTTVAGTAGNLVCSQPFIGSGYKKALVIVGATFVSVGGVTYTFPVAFTSTPVVTSGAVAGTTVTVSTTGVTVVAASALGALAGITVEGT